MLDIYPGRFDIVYYDALGSIFSKNVLNPILSLFTAVKLEPLSALITNFSAIAADKLDECASTISSYFRFRYNDLPNAFWEAKRFDPEECKYDDEELKAYIAKNPEPFYSDFITRFIADLAHSLIPNCRALGIRAIRDTYLANSTILTKTLDEAQRLPNESTTIDSLLADVGNVYLSPSSYPLFSFYKCLQESGHPFASKIGSIKFGGTEIHKLFGPASILDKVVEGHWNALSRTMLKAVTLSWFDVHCPFSCDAPLPNLLDAVSEPSE